MLTFPLEEWTIVEGVSLEEAVEAARVGRLPGHLEGAGAQATALHPAGGRSGN